MHEVLSSVKPLTSEGADALLDLREILMAEGHPGECLKCFFTLLGDLKKPGALRPLRKFLEERCEVEVCGESSELEAMPLRLEQGTDLVSFCHRAMETIRDDRAYAERSITMRVRWKVGDE